MEQDELVICTISIDVNFKSNQCLATQKVRTNNYYLTMNIVREFLQKKKNRRKVSKPRVESNK